MRKAIAMIELIFAIVILGITMMSAPMLVSQATQSSMVTFQQESIAIAASHASALMTYAWDERNTQGDRDDAMLTVAPDNLHVPNSINLAIRGNRLRQLAGDAVATNINNLGTVGDNDPSGNDDIDDFITNAVVAPLVIQSIVQNNTNQGEYMDQQVQVALRMNYMQDNIILANNIAFNNNLPFTDILPGVGVQSSHIKWLQVTLTTLNQNQDMARNIQLNAFVCNIGTSIPQRRTGI